MTEAKFTELVEKLSKIKPPEDRGDDFCVYDCSGGNVDDAYSMGCKDGEAYLAEELRSLLGIE